MIILFYKLFLQVITSVFRKREMEAEWENIDVPALQM